MCRTASVSKWHIATIALFVSLATVSVLAIPVTKSTWGDINNEGIGETSVANLKASEDGTTDESNGKISATITKPAITNIDDSNGRISGPFTKPAIDDTTDESYENIPVTITKPIVTDTIDETNGRKQITITKPAVSHSTEESNGRLPISIIKPAEIDIIDENPITIGKTTHSGRPTPDKNNERKPTTVTKSATDYDIDERVIHTIPTFDDTIDDSNENTPIAITKAATVYDYRLDESNRKVPVSITQQAVGVTIDERNGNIPAAITKSALSDTIDENNGNIPVTFTKSALRDTIDKGNENILAAITKSALRDTIDESNENISISITNPIVINTFDEIDENKPVTTSTKLREHDTIDVSEKVGDTIDESSENIPISITKPIVSNTFDESDENKPVTTSKLTVHGTIIRNENIPATSTRSAIGDTIGENDENRPVTTSTKLTGHDTIDVSNEKVPVTITKPTVSDTNVGGTGKKPLTITKGGVGSSIDEIKEITPVTVSKPVTGKNVNFDGSNESKMNKNLGPFGPCSRSCGTGVRIRRRSCTGLEMSLNDIADECVGGSTIEFDTCNPQACPPDAVDFRLKQCRLFDNTSHSDGNIYTWKPYNEGIRRESLSYACALVCQANENAAIINQFSPMVLDGTRCGSTNRGICVQGECKNFTQDNTFTPSMLPSKATQKYESTPERKIMISKKFQLHFGYNEVLDIPQTATNIQLHTLVSSQIIVALSQENIAFFLTKNIPTGSPQTPSLIHIGGSAFTWSLHSNNLSATSVGPLNSTIHVTILCKAFKLDQHVDIIYSMPETVVEQTTTLSYNIESPKIADEEEHDKENDPTYASGNAEIEHDNEIHDQTDHIGTRLPATRVIPNSLLAGLHSSGPLNTISDNINRFTKLGPVNLIEGEKANVIYPKNQAKGQFYTAKPPPANHNLNTEKTKFMSDASHVHNKNIKNSVLPSGPRKIIVLERPGGLPTTVANKPLTFIPEDTTYAGASTLRFTLTSNHYKTTSDAGQQSENDLSSLLGSEEADYYRWRRDIEGFCSSSCDSGVKVPYVTCEDRHGNKVDDSLCDPSRRPLPTKQVCNGVPCKPRWETGAWGPCSATCDRGLQKRPVHCWLIIAPGMRSSMHDVMCDADKKPPTVRPCQILPCTPTWFISKWSKCSVDCGSGFKTRTVWCSGEVCAGKRPKSHGRCMEKNCEGIQWSPGPWEKCTGECGKGLRHRSVHCTTTGGRLLNERRCPINAKPLTIEACSTTSAGCPDALWVPQAWGACSVTCGDGVTTRDVICSRIVNDTFEVLDKEECNIVDKPSNIARCRQQPCEPVWATTPFGDCPKECGPEPKYAMRYAVCLQNDLIMKCNQKTRPRIYEECPVNKCKEVCEDLPGNKCKLVAELKLCTAYGDKCCKSCSKYSKKFAKKTVS